MSRPSLRSATFSWELVIVVHGWWLPRNGINGWTGEPNVKYPPAVLLLALSGPALAQAPNPLLQRVKWQLADFVVLGDSTYGVQLLASPNLRSELGRGHDATTALSLDPAVAHQWARGVSRIIDSVARLPRRARVVFETVPLATNRGQGRLLVAYDGKGSDSKPFAFVVNGVTADDSWWLPVSNKELQQLFGAIDSIATHRSVRLTAAAAGQGGPVLICYLDERPQMVERGAIRHPDNFRALGRNARVLARYVIDTTGVIPADRVEILLSDGKAFTDEVQRGLTHRAYRPGRKDGHVVETVVWQWFGFTSN